MGFWWNWVKPRSTVTTEALLRALLKLVRRAMETLLPMDPERKRLETDSQQRPQLLVSRA
jgi:hypothetical protein